MQKHAAILVVVCRRAFWRQYIACREPGCKTLFRTISSNLGADWDAQILPLPHTNTQF